MKHQLLILSAVIVFLATSCQQEADWETLFNGDNLDNWDTYIGTPIKGYEDLAEKATSQKVFSITQSDGEPVIRISGEVNGSLATVEEYGNYHFHMEFKWGDKVYSKRNSGLLYHSYGPFGEALDTWMNAHEMQLLTGHVGDSYRMGNTYCEIPANELSQGRYQYDPNAERLVFGKDGVSEIAAKSRDLEKPIGEWNKLDLYCFDRISIHVVNGATVMVNYNSGKYTNGDIMPLTSGKIQIQSEGGELFIRDVKIKTIERLPEKVMPSS